MHAGKDEAGVAKYDARIMYAIPTPGLAEVEPSMNWNPSVVAGIGVVANPATLYNDMHSYLAASGVRKRCLFLLCCLLVQALILFCQGCSALTACVSYTVKQFWLCVSNYVYVHRPQ